MSAIFLRREGPRWTMRGQAVYCAANTQTFAEWSWDGEALRARTCALGVHPLFWRRLDSGIALATSPLDLLDEDVELDHPALAVFVRLGFFVGEDTPFAGIRQLPPGAELRWSAAEGLMLHGVELPVPEPAALDRDAAMDRYAELMREAVARCLPADGRLCVPLSGGRDSRHIAFALHHQGARHERFVTLKHLPGRSNEDARIAGLIARALNASHTVLEQPLLYVPNLLRNLRECGLCADEGGQLPPLNDWLRAHADTVFDGIGGDVMSAGLFQNESLHALFRAGDLPAVAQRMFADWRSSVRGWEYAADDALKRALSDEAAMERLLPELRRHQHHPNPARSFYFWNRTRREIALQPFKLFAVRRVETPFLDPALWAFLDSLPYEMVADQRFHTDTILRAYPRFAAIPFERKGEAAGTTAAQRMLLGLQLLPFLLGRPGEWRMAAWVQTIRLLAGIRIWWSPAMLLYLMELRARTAVAASEPGGAPQARLQ